MRFAFLLLVGALFGLLIITATRASLATASVENVSWGPETINVVFGDGQVGKDALLITLDDAGRGIVEVTASGEDLSDLTLLNLLLETDEELFSVVIAWNVAGVQVSNWMNLQGDPGNSLWLDMSSVETWRGSLDALGLALSGRPGTQIMLERISLTAPTLPHVLKAHIANWVGYRPWDTSSINFHGGVLVPGLSPSPVPVIAGILLMALVLVFITPLRRLRGAPHNLVIGLALIAWVVLDISWQKSLFLRMKQSWNLYAGVDYELRRAVSEDAPLYRFVEQARSLIDAENPRVFVSSANDYAGMRGAYFLYPLNVYWERKAGALPAISYLRSGDYLLLIPPTAEQYDSSSRRLLTADGEMLSVEPLLTHPLGQMYRLL